SAAPRPLPAVGASGDARALPAGRPRRQPLGLRAPMSRAHRWLMVLVVVLVVAPAAANLGQAAAAIAGLVALACAWQFAASEPTARVETPHDRTPRGLVVAMLGLW